MNDDQATTGELVPIDDPRDIRATGFDNMTKAEVQEMARRSAASRRKKFQAKRLAELQAFTEAHKELAAQLLGAKMTLLDGLLDEMDDGAGGFDTTKLDDRRIKLLMQLIDMLEKRAFGNITTKTETHSTVDVRQLVVNLTKQLGKPDDV